MYTFSFLFYKDQQENKNTKCVLLPEFTDTGTGPYMVMGNKIKNKTKRKLNLIKKVKNELFDFLPYMFKSVWASFFKKDFS